MPKKKYRQVNSLRQHRFSSISNLAEELITETDFQHQISAAQREHDGEAKEAIERRYQFWLESRVERLGEQIAECL